MGDEHQRQRPWEAEIAVKLPADAGFSEAEHWAWGKIIRGETADMRLSTGSDDGAGEDANEEIDGADGKKTLKPWPQTRVLSARFVDTILFHEPWASAKVKPWVDVKNAWVKGQLNWVNSIIKDLLGLDHCRIDEKLLWEGARFGESISLEGSRLEHGLSGDKLQVEGSLYCRGGFRAEGELRLLGARIGSNLEFSGATLRKGIAAHGLQVGGNFFCDDGFTAEGSVAVIGAHISGLAGFDDATLAEGLDADRLHVDGDLSCSSLKADGDISLVGARVGGVAKFDGATLGQGLDADRLKVDGDFSCERGFTSKGNVQLRGARIGGDMIFRSANMAAGFNASGAKIEGDLHCSQDFKAEGAVQLLDAHISGIASFGGATLAHGLSADRLQIERSLFCRGAFKTEGDLNLLSARIGGDVQMRGELNGLIDLTGTNIVGELQFDQGDGLVPTWGKAARLILRNVSCDALAGAIGSFERKGAKGKVEYVPVELLGFSYAKIGGLTGGGETKAATLADANARELIKFLQSDAPKRGAFSPQPYRQLANALMDAGQEVKANKIRFALFEHERAAAGVPASRKFVLFLSRLFIGHGFANWRAALGFGLVVLGSAAAGLAFEGRPFAPATPDWKAMADWGGFALGNSIPLVELDPHHSHFLDDRFAAGIPDYVKTSLYSAKLLGFVLLSYLAAGLSGFASRSARG